MTLSLEFDSDNFIKYYNSIGGDLSKTDFYTQRAPGTGTDATALMNTLLGVNEGTTTVDIQTLYRNWQSSIDTNEYAGQFFAQFFSGLSGKDFTNQWTNMQKFSSFLIQYYFTYKKSSSDLLPRITDPSGVGYYQQTDNIYSFFRDPFVRGIGNVTIGSLCTILLDPYPKVTDKRHYVSVNPELLGWCGCFTPTDPVIDQIESNFPKECDPLCVSEQSIKLFTNNGDSQLFCKSAVCVISDVTLNVEGSTNRQFNFNQICNACQDKNLNSGGQPCRCIIDSEFSSIISRIGADDPDGGGGTRGMDVGIVFERYCPNSVCYIIDRATGNLQTLPCNKLNPAVTGAAAESRQSGAVKITFSDKISFNTIALMCGIVIILILLSLTLLTRSEKKVTVIEKNSSQSPSASKGVS